MNANDVDRMIAEARKNEAFVARLAERHARERVLYDTLR